MGKEGSSSSVGARRGASSRVRLAHLPREETGWSVETVVADLGVMSWRGDDGADRHEVDYLVEVTGDLSRPTLEDGLHLDPRWVERDEALALLDGSHPSDELVRKVAERAFAALRRG
jgi:8-oxo-dGTP diphosphatase